ncbi:MAG: hypothetical protein HXK92_03860 [Lachnospiraceae bacterium]|nr:hypothetical protein [Lachnospiraceae bacterium]
MMELDLIRDIVQGIVEELDGIKGKGERTDYDAGQTVAYTEALSIIQSTCGDDNLQKIGLDFDIDSRYLLKGRE